ncbi:unnamed protein product, partial [marine sediment metagenome]
MKFTGHFTGIKLDLEKYRQRLRDHMVVELHNIAKIWLSAVTGRVPVWSGMSQGSLLKLSEMVGGRIVISPLVSSRVPKGRALGTAKPTYGPNDFIIEISTAVPHYVLQEYENVGISKSAPWLSFAAGASAYHQAVRTTRLP